MGSLNNSGTTVKECDGHSGLKSQSSNISVTRRSTYAPYDCGGIKMVDYENMVKAIGLYWLKRITDDSYNGFWRLILLIFYEVAGDYCYLIQCLKSLHDLDVFSLNINTRVNPDHNLNYKPIQCNYYSPYGFSQQKSFLSRGSSFSLLTREVYGVIWTIFSLIFWKNYSYISVSSGLQKLKFQFLICPLISILQYLIIAWNTYLHLYRLEVWVCIFTMTLILFRHRTEGSREIVLRLRELSVLPPLKAN